jgi:hypothetical protein
MAYFDNHFEVSGSVKAVKGFIEALGNKGAISADQLNNLVGNEPGESDDFEWVDSDDGDIECNLIIGKTMAWAGWAFCGGTSEDGEDIRKLSTVFKDLDFIHGFTYDAVISYFNHFRNGEVINSREYDGPLLTLSLVAIDTHTYLTGNEKKERILKEINELDLSILSDENALEWLSDEESASDDNIHMEANDILLLSACIDRLNDDFYQDIDDGVRVKINEIKNLASALMDLDGELPCNNPGAWVDEKGGE